MRCKMCNIWKKEIKEELSVAQIGNFFQKAPYFSWVGITGGEPFLRNDLLDIINVIVKYSKRLCAIHIATNGYLTDNIKTVIGEARRKYPKLKLVFTVSIDGPKSLHDDIRGVPGVWDKAVSTFCYLKQVPGAKVQFGFTISEHNIGKFKDTFEEFKKIYPGLRFDDVNVNIFQRSGFSYENSGMRGVSEANVMKDIASILAMDKDPFSVNNFLRRAYLKLYEHYVRLKKTPVKCQALSSSLYIDPYGNLYPCMVFNKKLINIRELETDFYSFWNSDIAKKASEECVKNLCPLCWSPCDAFSSISTALPKTLRYAYQPV